MSDCVICVRESSTKIPNLRKLELSVCINADCVARFITGKEGRLPICKYCSLYCKKENLCPTVELNSFLMRIGGIDLKFPKFALFCDSFDAKGGSYGKLIPRG